MSITYVRPPCNPDGSRKSFAQRRAERKQQEVANRESQKSEPTARAAIYGLPADERRRLRRAEEQGRREGQQRAAMEAQAKRHAEYDALPEHERRPRNTWRDLIEQWRGQEYRPEVKRKLSQYAIEADREDVRIDAMMAEAKRKYEIDNDAEVIRARAHLELVKAGAEPEEQAELSRLGGVLSAGQTSMYWDSVVELTTERVRRVQEQVAEHAAKVEPLNEEARILADKQKAAEALQIESPETQTN